MEFLSLTNDGVLQRDWILQGSIPLGEAAWHKVGTADEACMTASGTLGKASSYV